MAETPRKLRDVASLGVLKAYAQRPRRRVPGPDACIDVLDYGVSILNVVVELLADR